MPEIPFRLYSKVEQQAAGSACGSGKSVLLRHLIGLEIPAGASLVLSSYDDQGRQIPVMLGQRLMAQDNRQLAERLLERQS